MAGGAATSPSRQFRRLAGCVALAARVAGAEAQRLHDAQECARQRDLAVFGAVTLPSQASPLEVRTEYNPERRTAVQIVPALIGAILHLTMVVFTAIALVRERERERGNLELLITPRSARSS